MLQAWGKNLKHFNKEIWAYTYYEEWKIFNNIFYVTATRILSEIQSKMSLVEWYDRFISANFTKILHAAREGVHANMSDWFICLAPTQIQ